MKNLAVVCFFSLTASVSAAVWEIPGDFPTIQAAIDSSLVITGDKIRLGPGSHAGALVTKSVEIKGEGGAIINAGPAHGSGLSQGFRLMGGGDGATISHLTFTTDLSIMNGAAVDSVTVTQCTFHNSIQAISNWGGSEWEISHNVITDLRTRSGGGIGILVADYTGGTVQDNVVSHNKISGTLHVHPDDGGGYCGTGIVLYADFRWNRQGAQAICYNRVVKNKVSLVSDTPTVVNVWGLELTDTRDDNTLPDVVHHNAIGFNDLRGMTPEDHQIALTPSDLDNPVNKIDRNLGDNRGQALYHPSVFVPGGN